MRAFDWIRERFSAPGIEPSGAAVLTTSWGMNGNESIVTGLLGDHVSAYYSDSIVFGAILARMSLFSEARFCFQDLTDKHIFGHNEVDGRRNVSLRKLENPWVNGTTGDLLNRMLQHADLAGNAYVWDTGTRLVLLRPDWVTIVSAEAYDPMGRMYREVLGYYFDPPPTATEFEPMYLLREEVAHWAPIPDPTALWRGMSWMTPVAREILGDRAMTEYKIRYLENAASPNLLVRYTQKLGNNTVNRIRDRIEARHGGVDNAFGTLVLDEGADVTVIGNSLEQMNFSTVQAAGENRILIASGVPGIVVGAKEGLMAATYSNYEQALRRFADITMRPLWRSAAASLSSLVKVPQNARLWVDLTDIAALRQGEKEQADTSMINAQAIASLTGKGFKAESIVQAIHSGDLSLLEVEPPKPVPAALASGLNGQDPAAPGAPAPALNGKVQGQ